MNDQKALAAMGPRPAEGYFASVWFELDESRYRKAMNAGRALSIEDIKVCMRIFFFNSNLGRVVLEGVVIKGVTEEMNEYLGETKYIILSTEDNPERKTFTAGIGLTPFLDTIVSVNEVYSMD